MLNIEITPKNLTKFVLPSILMMFFLSLYTIINGLFIARIIGTDGLTATNIFFPLFNLFIAISIMIRNGGSAFVGKLLGENNETEANKNFSMLIYTQIIISIFLAIVILIFLEPILYKLGATKEIIDLCKDYSFWYIIFLPALFLNLFFQNFFILDGKPKTSMFLTIIGGITNVVLNYIFMKVFNMGIKSASIATGLSFVISSIYGLIYFKYSNSAHLKLEKFYFNVKNMIKICSNGSSEMVTNISLAFTTYLFNMLLMKHIGIDGVSAISIIFYISFFLVSVFIGYAIGTSPLISFNYGKQDHNKLKKLFKYGLYFSVFFSILTATLSFIFAENLAGIFAKNNLKVIEITTHALKLYSLGFLFLGPNLLSSAFFTSLSDGKVSAILSFLRNLFFLTICLYIMPKIFGQDGIWLATFVAEALTFLIAIYCVLKYSKKYKYL